MYCDALPEFVQLLSGAHLHGLASLSFGAHMTPAYSASVLGSFLTSQMMALVAVQLMRGIADVAGWIACGWVCWILLRVAWKLRGRVRFGVTATALIALLAAVAVNRFYDFAQLQWVPTAQLLLPMLWTSLLSIIVSAAVIAICPFLRGLAELGLMNDQERRRETAPAPEPATHADAPPAPAAQVSTPLPQTIFEDAPFSIVFVDAKGMITGINSATQALTQYRGEELIGKHSLALLHDPVELKERSLELSCELGLAVAPGFETLSAIANRWHSAPHEWTYLRKDGRPVAVQLAVTALRDAANKITGYLAVAFDLSERKALSDSVSFLAHHDALTGLPNRVMLNSHLEQAVQHASSTQGHLAVFVIDIDHFKRINGSLGHKAGDDVLVRVGERLKHVAGPDSFVSRPGGDEFVVVIPQPAGEGRELEWANRLLESFQPATIAGHHLSLTATIGVCSFPAAAADATSLLRNADVAMYAAKQRGGNNVHAFSAGMLVNHTGRLELEADLHRALERNELEVFYQPQINARTREITGFEALIRWNHPVRGLLLPAEFIQAAEESGLIVPIGEWVIRQACKEVRQMQLITGRRLKLAVNLSPRQILQTTLVPTVQDALLSTGLLPRDLELEITEHTLMISSPETVQVLADLRRLGVRLAVDDFGTGFSSFHYILQYKVDLLKIDRSFVANCASDASAAAVVRTIIAMSHGLNMTVVAEGVETEEQLAFLARRRCDEVQGFRFGRPVSMADTLARLLEEAPAPAPGKVERVMPRAIRPALDMPAMTEDVVAIN